MHKKIHKYVLLIVMSFGPFALFSQGNLVIVGGGLENDNAHVFEEYIRLAGGKDAVFSIIPSASGVPVQSFEYFKLGLTGFGVNPENIHLIPIAMEDDDSTLLVDESTWANNAWQKELEMLVLSSTAVWFTGGDQTRTMKLMHDTSMNQSPVLKAVWEVYKRGGVIGGTSAGAAIMSNPMIGGGTSIAALQNGVTIVNQNQDSDEYEGMILTDGIGFFPLGIVDQHFHARARSGRLIAALAATDQRFGFGIDENTALVYYGNENRIRVFGEDALTIFDTKNAQFNRNTSMLSAENIIVHFLESGSQYFVDQDRILADEADTQASLKLADKEVKTLSSGALTNSKVGFNQLLNQLLRNPDNVSVRNLHMIEADKGFEISLSRTEETKHFINKDYKNEKHSLGNLRMDIIPLRIHTDKIEF